MGSLRRSLARRPPTSLRLHKGDYRAANQSWCLRWRDGVLKLLAAVGSRVTSCSVKQGAVDDMKRIKMIELALVALVVLSVISISAASAMIQSKAEFIKNGTDNGFKGKSRVGLEPTFITPLNTIKCKSDTSTGSISGGTKSMSIENFVIIFKECKATTNGGCTVKSKGAAKAEEIVTTVLKGTLGRVLSKEATTEVGLVLEGPGSVFVTLEGTCLTVSPAKVVGQIVGEVRPVNAGLKMPGELFFEPVGAGQRIKKICLLPFGGLPCDGVLHEEPLEAFASEVMTEMTAEELTFNESTEVKVS